MGASSEVVRDGLLGVLFGVEVEYARFGGGVLPEAGVVLCRVEVGGGIEVAEVFFFFFFFFMGGGGGGFGGGRRWDRGGVVVVVENFGDLLGGFEFEDVDFVDGVGDGFEVGARVRAADDGVGG